MSNINFFTALKFNDENKSTSKTILEKVDNYFYLGGKKALVLSELSKDGRTKVVLSGTNSSLLARVGKVFSYFTVIIPIFMLVLKLCLRSAYSFKLIDAKAKIEKNMDINDNILLKMQELLPKIAVGEEDEQIEWLSQGNNLVFKLEDSPNLVFKMASPNQTVFRGGKTLDSKALSDERFANMIKAKEVCLVNQLGLLTIPHAKKFKVEVGYENYTLIAEEVVDIDPNESVQEELFHKYSTELNETARQLATFIAKTGFNDVVWRNIPVINQVEDGNRSVALIDLESMENVESGFMGGSNGSRGLIRCASSEEQIDIVIAEVNKQGVGISEEEVAEMKYRRLEELESDSELRTFYEQKGIKTGKEQIDVDINELGLNLDETAKFSVLDGFVEGEMIWKEQTITLREVIEEVVAKMNLLIEQSSNESSLKGKRRFLLQMDHYHHLGLPPNTVLMTAEMIPSLWLSRIIQALVEKRHIFKLEKRDNYGYHIQA